MTDCKTDNAQCTTRLGRLAEVTSGGHARTMPDKERAARLRQARSAKGYDTAVGAARAFGWIESTYSGHENGTRGMRRETIIRYCTAFNVDETWLSLGVGDPRTPPKRVPVEGTLGMGGVIESVLTGQVSQSIKETVEFPPEAEGEFQAFRVNFDYNYPAFFKDDIVYTEMPTDPESLLGKQCIATLASGERRICILGRSAIPGLFMLLSFNASPINDVEVTEAARVAWIKRG